MKKNPAQQAHDQKEETNLVQGQEHQKMKDVEQGQA